MKYNDMQGIQPLVNMGLEYLNKPTEAWHAEKEQRRQG